jgi:hypothetical protein
VIKLPVKKKDVLISTEQGNNGNYITITDAETGEVINRFWQGQYKGPPGRKKEKTKQPQFARIWMPNLLKVVLEKGLTTLEKALLFDLIAFLDWQSTMLVHPENGRPINESQIATLLSYSRPTVHDALISLNEKGIIGKFNAGKGLPNKYHMNPNLMFYGQRMNDRLDIERFNSDCAFSPVVRVQYEVEEKIQDRKTINYKNKERVKNKKA